MNVITLNESEFEKACKSLAVKVAESGDVTALIGVRTGGATVVKSAFSYLVKQGSDLEVVNDSANNLAGSFWKYQNIQLFADNWFKRRITIIRMGFYKYGLIRNIALMLWI